jgi:L-asparaginase
VQDGHIIFYIDDKKQDTNGKQVKFYHSLDTDVALLKLIPSMNASILDYMAEHFDAVIIESFGVGGLPSYETGDYYKAVSKWIALGKTVVMSTQVPKEGSNMTVYEVGRTIKKDFGLLERTI